MRDASELRFEVFEDTDLSRDLKLFTLAAIHLYEHAAEYKRVKQFRRPPWPYRAMRLAGWSGTDDELTSMLRGLIRDDVPKFRMDFSIRPACVGVMLRPAGAPCRKKATHQASIPSPFTGERTMIGACSDARHVAVYHSEHKAAWMAWRANGEPTPKPNSGGLLLRYFTSGIEELYAWADKDYQRGDVVPVVPDRPLAIVTELRSTETKGN